MSCSTTGMFDLQHPDQCQWFEVVPRSLIIIFFSSKYLKTYVIEHSNKKLEFMILLGVISLQIEDYFVLKNKESGIFTFENSLIQATFNDNNETVQFLLKQADVNVNSQREEPITGYAPD